MNNLSDDLLMEIWCRVPYKIAVSCKSISKRFLALISTPEFIKCSIYHSHKLIQHMKDEDHQQQWYLNFVSWRKLLILFLPNLHLSNPQNQLPWNFIGQKFNVAMKKRDILYSTIVGYSNGLLLCKSIGEVYYVCNPVTRDWVLLPPLPPPHNQCDRTREGFICEPHYELEGNSNRVTFNSHRFRLVRFGTSKYVIENCILWVKFEIVIFSSETGQWSKKLVSCPKGFKQDQILQAKVAHGGKIYFMRKMDLLVYDPFNNDGECHTINYPPKFFSSFGHIGVCCGNIRIACISLSMSRWPIIEKVCVWELEQDHCSWRLLHMTRFPRHNLELRNSSDVTVVRAFHPHHTDVVFFQRAHCIFVANLKTNRFEIFQYETQKYEYQSWQIISLDLPLWPTPIPSIT